ncbi:MAG: hypothetical protein LW822_06045 [Phycisphaeraceae bacterium]|nr:hypothetical protein [Phycisphaeraceae bacterium]
MLAPGVIGALMLATASAVIAHRPDGVQRGRTQPEPAVAPGGQKPGGQESDQQLATVAFMPLQPGVPIVAGGRGWVVLEFSVLPGWHTYWPGQNATGAPVSMTWKLPPGLKVGAPIYPLPTRHVGGGDLLDYVLEGKFVVVVPVEVDASVAGGPLGEPVLHEIGVDVEYLVCKESCVPGEASLRTKIGVVVPGKGQEDVKPSPATPVAGADARAKEIKEIWSGLPVVASSAERDRVVSHRWSGAGPVRRLEIEVAFRGAEEDGRNTIEFAPFAGGPELLDALTDAQGVDGKLSMRLKIGTGTAGPVRGVVILGSGQKRIGYQVEFPLPATTSPAKGPKDSGH